MVETRAQLRNRVIWDRVESAQGVFIDILSRLSVRSIRSFKKVNKYWYGSISNKYFTKQQLAQSRENPSYIACPIMDRTMKLYSMKPGSFKLSHLNTIDPSERSEEEYMYMISSFNGLICCVNNIFDEDVGTEFCDLQIWISNPCTGETFLLPQGRPSFKYEPSVGVAYGSDISDYKVFRIFCAGKKIPEEKVSEEIYFREGQLYRKCHYAVVYECEVYSSSTGSWANIGPVPCAPMYAFLSPFKSSHIFVGGKIYWLSSLDEPGAILYVDLEGRFDVIKLPPYPDHLVKEEDRITEATYLINLRGSLSVVVLHTDYMDIWVRNEEIKQSDGWVHEYRDSIPFDEMDLVLAMTSSKNQILCMTETRWYYYNVDTGKWKKRKANARFVNPAVFPFTESVLPCNGGVMVQQEH